MRLLWLTHAAGQNTSSSLCAPTPKKILKKSLLTIQAGSLPCSMQIIQMPLGFTSNKRKSNGFTSSTKPQLPRVEYSGRPLHFHPASTTHTIQVFQKHPFASALAFIQQEPKCQNFCKVWTKWIKTEKLKAFLMTKSQLPSHKALPFAACWSSTCASNYTLIAFADFHTSSHLRARAKGWGFIWGPWELQCCRNVLHCQQGSHWKLGMISGAQAKSIALWWVEDKN